MPSKSLECKKHGANNFFKIQNQWHGLQTYEESTSGSVVLMSKIVSMGADSPPKPERTGLHHLMISAAPCLKHTWAKARSTNLVLSWRFITAVCACFELGKEFGLTWAERGNGNYSGCNILTSCVSGLVGLGTPCLSRNNYKWPFHPRITKCFASFKELYNTSGKQVCSFSRWSECSAGVVSDLAMVT